MTPFTVIIPARLASTRLPNKVLLPIAGKPMLQHVIERAQSSGAARIVLAAGDEDILALGARLSVETCVTEIHHKTGTDRVAEAVEKLQLPAQEIIVALQGDEPMLPGKLIDQLAQALSAETVAPVATLSMPITDAEDLENPNCVKVVTDQNDHALYFSRAHIPFPRQGAGSAIDCHRHIGLYAYRAGFLKTYSTWPEAPLEKTECLEQLRILWHGQKILVKPACEHPGHGVDTQADLDKLNAASN